MDIPILKTDRLVLRGPELSDFDVFAAYRMGPRSASVGGPFTLGRAWTDFGEIIGHWRLRGFGRWIVADQADNAPLGVVGLYHPADWPEPEIGWTVFDGAEGKGVAHEAALASRQYAYDVMGWTRIVSMISGQNTRSIALAERMGCVREADYLHDSGPLRCYRHQGPAV